MSGMTQTSSERGNYPLRAVDRVCDILDILANSSTGASLTTVAEDAGLPKSSVFRYLSALEARNYVERDEEGAVYRLGLAFRPQNTRAIEQLVHVGKPEIDRLRNQLQETVNIGVLDGASILHVAVSESPHMMRLAARVDERGSIHSTALGKAISSTLPDSLVRSMLATSGMPELTKATITDPEKFLSALGDVRRSGFGMDDEENQPAGRCVAVPIPNFGLPAGISVSAPLDRLPMEQVPAVVAELSEAAALIGSLLSQN